LDISRRQFGKTRYEWVPPDTSISASAS